MNIDYVKKKLDESQIDVTNAVISLLRERKQKGLEEYGKPMQPFIHEPAALHSLEETVDRAVYEMSKYLELQTAFYLLDEVTQVMLSGDQLERLEAYKAYQYIKERMNIHERH